MTGIYKITSPNNKIYIGQSVNIEKRFKHYKFKDCKSQCKLYNSFLKYGSKNHIFEILEECNKDLLTEREGYWQDYYNTINNGLNCRRVTTNDKTGYLSNETKSKISLANKNRKYSEKVLENIRRLRKERIITKETLLKMSESGKNRVFTSEYLEKLSINNKLIFSKKVIDITNNKIYSSCREASKSLGISEKTLSKKLLGKRNNNTNLRYIDNYANNSN